MVHYKINSFATYGMFFLSQSHLPAASSSPATYDNNNDICDDNNESCDYNNETSDDNSVTCDSQKDPVSAGKTEVVTKPIFFSTLVHGL